MMQTACHLAYPWASMIAPDLQPPALLCARAPGTTVFFGALPALFVVFALAVFASIAIDALRTL